MMSINKVMAIGMSQSANVISFARMNRDSEIPRERFPTDHFYYDVSVSSMNRLKDIIHEASMSGVTESVVFSPGSSDLVIIWMKRKYYTSSATEQA